MNMNAIRLAAGIVIVTLASTTFNLAMGEDVTYLPPPSTPDFRECALVADAFDRPYFSSGPSPSFYLQTEALFFQQVPRFGAQPIVVNNTNDTTLMSTSNLNPTFNPGLQATLGRQLQNGQTVELEYLGLFGGSSSAVALKPGPAAFLTFPNNLAGNALLTWIASMRPIFPRSIVSRSTCFPRTFSPTALPALAALAVAAAATVAAKSPMAAAPPPRANPCQGLPAFATSTSATSSIFPPRELLVE